MRFITVTRKSDGSKMCINAEHIVVICSYYNKPDMTVIVVDGGDSDYYVVSESVKTVEKLILGN